MMVNICFGTKMIVAICCFFLCMYHRIAYVTPDIAISEARSYEVSASSIFFIFYKIRFGSYRNET